MCVCVCVYFNIWSSNTYSNTIKGSLSQTRTRINLLSIAWFINHTHFPIQVITCMIYNISSSYNDMANESIYIYTLIIVHFRSTSDPIIEHMHQYTVTSLQTCICIYIVYIKILRLNQTFPLFLIDSLPPTQIKCSSRQCVLQL